MSCFWLRNGGTDNDSFLAQYFKSSHVILYVLHSRAWLRAAGELFLPHCDKLHHIRDVHCAGRRIFQRGGAQGEDENPFGGQNHSEDESLLRKRFSPHSHPGLCLAVPAVPRPEVNSSVRGEWAGWDGASFLRGGTIPGTKVS